MPGRAAAIALPARGIGGVAADHLRIAGTERQMVDLPERNDRRHAAGERQRERAVVAEERLAVRRDEQDLPVRREAAHHHVGTEPRHAPRQAAFGGHHIDLGMLLVAADERDALAVGRKGRRRRLAQPRGQPARDAAAGADAPEVVVANEDDRVVANRRMAKVARLRHGVAFVIESP
jgi:hypothetical protein